MSLQSERWQPPFSGEAPAGFSRAVTDHLPLLLWEVFSIFT